MGGSKTVTGVELFEKRKHACLTSNNMVLGIEYPKDTELAFRQGKAG
jgi:hypothetical protein